MVLTDPAGAQIAGVVSYNGTERRARLNPSANLRANTTYTVTLTGGATAIRATTGGVPLDVEIAVPFVEHGGDPGVVAHEGVQRVPQHITYGGSPGEGRGPQRLVE